MSAHIPWHLGLWGVSALLALVLSGCESRTDSASTSASPPSSEASDPMQLNLAAAGPLVVDSEQNLGQIVSISSPSSQASKGEALKAIRDNAGNPLHAECAIPVNSRYVFLKGFGARNRPDSYKDVIVDLQTGKFVRLSQWPWYPQRVIANPTHAFFVSEYKIYAVALATGDSTMISDLVPIWRNGSDGYNDNQVTLWSAMTWLFVDENSNLYAIDYRGLSNGRGEGSASKFVFENGSWLEDTDFDRNFFPRMPYEAANSIPGSSLVNAKRIVVDSSQQRLYEIEMAGASVKIRPYDVDNWQAGAVILEFPLSHPMTQSSYIGIDGSIQDGLITDGTGIIRVKSDAGNLSVEEIAVPAAVKVEETVRYPGYVSSWPTGGAVTNWNYLQGGLYYYDDSDRSVYLWDLNPSQAPVSMGPLPWMTFLFLQDR